MYIDQENGVIETILKIKEFKIKKIYLITWYETCICFCPIFSIAI